MSPISSELVKEWQMEHLSEEERAVLIDRLGRLLYQALLVRSLDVLDEGEEVEFDALMNRDETTPEDVVNFLQKRIPAFPELLSEEIGRLKKDILG